MTRLISNQAAVALYRYKKFTMDNTKVIVDLGEAKLLLHGNKIARKDENGNIFINFQSFRTRTTVDRLEAVTDLQFSIAKDKLRYRQYAVDNWVEINSWEWYKLVEKDGKKWLELSK